MPEPRATSVLLSNLPDDLCKDMVLNGESQMGVSFLGDPRDDGFPFGFPFF